MLYDQICWSLFICSYNFYILIYSRSKPQRLRRKCVKYVIIKKDTNNTGLPLYLETLKKLEFDNLGKKYLEFEKVWKKNLDKPWTFNNFNMFSSKNSTRQKKSIIQTKFLLIIINFFIKKHIKLNFKLKIDPEICNFKNLEKIRKKRVATLCHVLSYLLFLCSNLILIDNN